MTTLEITKALNDMRPSYYTLKEYRSQLPEEDALSDKWFDTTEFIIDFNTVTRDWFEKPKEEVVDDYFIAQMSDRVIELRELGRQVLQYLINN